jgi:dimethylhistidine N-methyltransferase
MTTQTATNVSQLEQFSSDVRYYLTLQPRQLPSRYFYDEVGSALFEVICELPWYRITRAETRLLAVHGRAILARVPDLTTLVELGPGNGRKLATLIESGRSDRRPLDVHLVDVSPSALTDAVGTLGAIPAIHAVAHEASYEAGLGEAVRETQAGSTLVLFLGSNLGNFDRPGAEAFLRGVRAACAPGDTFLLGADLVKPERELLLAYDDPLGVTAAFNRNLLVRINRELGGNFELDAFAHLAVWNETESRVEMHLRSERRSHVHIGGAATDAFDIVIEPDESIWTESSYKYQPEELVLMLERAGFRLLDQWLDRDDAFALTMVAAA